MKNGLIERFGNQYWYLNGEYHREDGPAVIWFNGDKEWYQYGQYHRIDGPAIKWSDGQKQWWYRGIRIECNTQEEFERIINLRMFW